MSTAISYVSESGDHYLNLFDDAQSIKEIVAHEQKQFDAEFASLEVKNCVSSDHNEQDVCQALCDAISKAYDDE